MTVDHREHIYWKSNKLNMLSFMSDEKIGQENEQEKDLPQSSR